MEAILILRLVPERHVGVQRTAGAWREKEDALTRRNRHQGATANRFQRYALERGLAVCTTSR